MGGQALSPPSSCSCFVFHVKLNEFSGAHFLVLLNSFCFFILWTATMKEGAVAVPPNRPVHGDEHGVPVRYRE